MTDTIKTTLPPYILAVDQATRSGWAIVLLGDGTVYASGVYDSRGHKEASGESRGMRFVRFAKWLSAMTAPAMPAMICHEQTIAMGMGGKSTSWATNDIAAGLKALMEKRAAELGIPITTVCPSTLKKWATGSGRAGKAEMIKAASDKTRRKITDDNEADAILIGLWAYNQYAAGLKMGGRKDGE